MGRIIDRGVNNMAAAAAVSCYTDVDRNAASLWQTAFQVACGQSLVGQGLTSIYRNKFLPFRLRVLLWNALHRSHLDLSWLEDFNAYWTRVLGGRPVGGLLGFPYLYGVYRRRFFNFSQSVSISPANHDETWQSQALLYQLVDHVYRESRMSNSDSVSHIRKYSRKHSTVLEYGAGIAPITRAAIQFGYGNKRKFIIADLQTYAFHYAKQRFTGRRDVLVEELRRENGYELASQMDVDLIFCREVFEHLPDPIATVKMFEKMLISGGVLIFDYVKSDAIGLDTSAGMSKRAEVLEYIDNRFVVIEGSLADRGSSLPTTVVRRNT